MTDGLTTASAIRRRQPAWIHAVLAGVSVLAVGTFGSMATGPNIPTWYAFLTKPWFAPPNWLFGPAWTVLYVLMAYAFYRVLRRPAGPARNRAIYAFAIQLALNALWPFAFFGARSPLLGMTVIVPLWAMIAVTIRRFARVDPSAAVLLGPYLAWVTYAAVLNAGFWLLN